MGINIWRFVKQRMSVEGLSRGSSRGASRGASRGSTRDSSGSKGTGKADMFSDFLPPPPKSDLLDLSSADTLHRLRGEPPPTRLVCAHSSQLFKIIHYFECPLTFSNSKPI